MTRPGVFHTQKRILLLCQLGVLLLIWVYVVGLHATNDGLWYQGDAPRHAANGLFWKDFLARFPVHPVDFAVSYYLRYPVITPSVYPPGFYLLEAAAFSLLGSSPFVAKGLVLAFTLVAGLYLMAWLRRWVSEEAGWGGALLILQPGVIAWSHAVMLNIPSMALGLAALYHARRWMESPASRHLYAAAGFTAFGIMTYVHTAIVLPVILAWIISERRWALLWNRRVWRLMLVGAAIVLPWAFIAVKWAPVHASLVLPTVQQVLSSTSWTFYLKPLPRLFSVLLLALATAGIVGGMADARWRREVKYTVTWIAVGYVALSLMMAKEPRYALLLGPPAVFLGMIGLCSLSQWTSRLVGGTSSWFLKSGMACVLVFHVWMAPHVLPVVEGMQEVVAFLEEKGRDERLFYDGHYNGMFSFYVRARDPDFRRGVVRGDKLLYPSAMNPGWYLTERVSSAADVVTVLQRECGCRWLALERRNDLGTEQIRAPQYLRKAVAGPEFKLVKSFPLHVVMRSEGTPDDTQIDVYEFLAFIGLPLEYEFRMPILGGKTIIRGKPID
jgi:4-amino-4-deoxy-L-arabinose transferase-like glycosyltransferase